MGEVRDLRALPVLFGVKLAREAQRTVEAVAQVWWRRTGRRCVAHPADVQPDPVPLVYRVDLADVSRRAQASAEGFEVAKRRMRRAERVDEHERIRRAESAGLDQRRCGAVQQLVTQ